MLHAVDVYLLVMFDYHFYSLVLCKSGNVRPKENCDLSFRNDSLSIMYSSTIDLTLEKKQT